MHMLFMKEENGDNTIHAYTHAFISTPPPQAVYYSKLGRTAYIPTITPLALSLRAISQAIDFVCSTGTLLSD